MLKASVLERLCGLYCEAGLQTDLARRIMLGLIPSTQSPTERAMTAGIGDYKALKAAINPSAKNLVHYGAKACAEELTYFSKEISKRCTDLINAGDFGGSLLLARDSFARFIKTLPGFGGKLWINIAEQLLQLEYQRINLEDLRTTSRSQHRDPYRDYLSDEVRLMRDMVMRMNMIDQLAHNSGSFLTKLFRAEEESAGAGVEIDFDAVEKSRKMQDAKELQSPAAIYKLIKNDIENDPATKHLFRDYITKMREHPDFWKDTNHEDELIRIRLKRELGEFVGKMDALLEKATAHKDKLISGQSKNPYTQLYGMEQYLGRISEELTHISDHLTKTFGDEGENINADLRIRMITLEDSIVKEFNLIKRNIGWLRSIDILAINDPKKIPVLEMQSMLRHTTTKINAIAAMIEGF